MVTAVTENSILFDTATGSRNANHYFEVGQVYSILTTSSEKPECLMVRRGAEGISASTPVKFYRGYGGTTDIEIGDNSGAIYKRGLGWNIGVIEGSGEGGWEAKSYEFW